MRIANFILLIIVLSLGACTPLPAQEQATPIPDQTEQITPEQTGAPLPDPGDGQDEPSPAALPEGAVIEFRRSGGIAGVDEVWMVYTDGRVTFAEGDQPEVGLNEWQADPEQVETLLKTIDSLGFFTLQTSGKPENPCCDRFTYSLTVAYQGKVQQLSAVEGDSAMPESFYQIVSEIDAFIRALTQYSSDPVSHHLGLFKD